ncbi:MAG: hypothetical protein HRU18_12000 [Pseudoalteromonas sp.]|uniref:hypothetical protein n=1 Tax=Pseudoalteromonas sp. TaxID=53249 RepID=UPI001D6D4DAA|nr:hypothetical protein [Pseudoalteromonas sp.]NRA78924.1 hypothetical protein [Pseudoalteromonas sp.]
MGQQQKHEQALEFARALVIRREEAMECENAKLSALEMVNFKPEYLEPITNRYKALNRLIKWMERKLNNLCAED